MNQDFYFSGMDGGWFANCFEPYHLFGYIGDRDNLKRYQQEKPFVRRLIELVAPSISITSILGKIAGINLGLGKSDSQIAKKVIDLVNETEEKRHLDDFLKIAKKKLTKKGRNFDSIGDYYKSKNAISNAVQGDIQGRLVSVEAQLLNRSAVDQFAPESAQQLRVSNNEWLLSDFPPPGLLSGNEFFKGNLLRLEEDKDFSDAFSTYLPFARSIGWYPYCRITGFYDNSSIHTEIFPKMTMCFIEYRPPRLFRDVSSQLYRFISSEMKDPIWLRSMPDLIVASYLLPLLATRSALTLYRVPIEHKEDVKLLIDKLGYNMPHALRDWYAQAVSH